MFKKKKERIKIQFKGRSLAKVFFLWFPDASWSQALQAQESVSDSESEEVSLRWNKNWISCHKSCIGPQYLARGSSVWKNENTFWTCFKVINVFLVVCWNNATCQEQVGKRLPNKIGFFLSREVGFSSRRRLWSRLCHSSPQGRWAFIFWTMITSSSR